MLRLLQRDSLAVVFRAAVHAFLGSIPILAVLVIALDAVLPKPDPASGERAGSWLAPTVCATAAAIYLALLFGLLYVNLARQESLRTFIGRRAATAANRIAAAAASARGFLGPLLDALIGRAVAVGLVIVAAFLAIALLWIGATALRIAPWWTVAIVAASVVVIRSRA
jgi:hypothetical protein